MTALLARLVPRFEAWGDDRGLARAYHTRPQIPWVQCRFEQAREDCALALRHARAARDGTFERASATMKAMAGLLGPAHVEQIRADVADLETQAIRFPSLRMPIGTGSAMVAAMLGRLEEARRLLGEAHLAAVQMLGEPRTGTLQWSYQVEMLLGDPAAAEPYARQAYEMMHEHGDLSHSSTAAGDRAIVALELGHLEEARRFAAECRDTSANDDVVNQCTWRRVEARLLAGEGRYDDATSLIREAVRWVEQTDMLLEQAETAFDEAEIHRLAGRIGEARSALHRARDAAERKGATVLVERADRSLAEVR